LVKNRTIVVTLSLTIAGAKSVCIRVLYRLRLKSTAAITTIDGLSDVASLQRYVVCNNVDMSLAMSLAPRSSTRASAEVVARPVAPTPS
jgi:hypothetical protein